MNNTDFPLFLSTAIPYVNAAPHIGHAFELLIGDVLARHRRQRGRKVYLTGGTDDHSAKNARAAAQSGLATAELVARNGSNFRRLQGALGVELDDYLHTSSDPRHAPAVVALWRRCAAAGDLYRDEYSGLYCVGCEAFLSESDLVDGRCATHREPLERIRETNWFFRLSRYAPKLLAELESGALRIEPRERHNEVESFIRGGLRDFSVSRSRERSRGWGIPVPDDPSQVIYVWFDALTNYLSLLGFPDCTTEWQRHWATASAQREHLIGKDILRFHAVYWPALLLSAGLSLPTCVRVHGYVTISGEKIGKSLGNAVDPFALVESYGADATRFYLLKQLHTTKDSDFSLERLLATHDDELAAKLGNLLQRATALAVRHPELCLRPKSERDAKDRALAAAATGALTNVIAAVDDFALHRAIAAVFTLVAAANRYADEKAPWTLSRAFSKNLNASSDDAAQLSNVLWHLFETLRVTAVLLAPFLPNAARSILTRLGVPLEQLADLRHARFETETTFAPLPGPALFPALARSAAQLR